MNNRDMLDCLVFGLSRGVVPAQRQPRLPLEERFPPSVEEAEPAKTGGIVARLWQILRHRRPTIRLPLLHRRLQHCG